MSQIKSGLKAQIDWPNTQGDGWTCRFRVGRNGTYPVSWTGYTFVGQVRRFASPTSTLIATITFDLTEGNGWITMTVADDNERNNAAPGDYYYDVKWTPPNGELKTLFGGKFPVAPRVTVA